MPKRAGLIGGSGLLQSSFFKENLNGVEKKIFTPFGDVTYKLLTKGDLELVFIQRHKADPEKDYSPPHLVNHRAIWSALKHLQVEFVVGICSVGSLKSTINVGTLLIPDDYFCPWKLISTYDDGRAHKAPQIDEGVRSLLKQALKGINLSFVDGGVYVNSKGPRFETKSEIKFMAHYSDIVGMTAAHEATLSVELGIPYGMLCIVDNMANGLSEELSYESFKAAQKENEGLIESAVEAVINQMEAEPSRCKNSQPVTSSEFDYVIHAKYVVTVNESDAVIENGAVGVKGGVIKKIGTSTEADNEWNVGGATVIKKPNGILMPGLINAHTHASMVYMRGCADDLELTKWLTQKIWPAEMACMSEEFVRESVTLAIAEMIKGGTTCFNDMYFFPEAVSEQVYELGMRGFSGAIVIEFPSAYGKDADDYLAKGKAMIEKYAGKERVHFTVSPHSPYTVSEEHLKQAHALAKSSGVPFHIHLHETHKEVHDSEQGNGGQFAHNSPHQCRPLENFHRLGILDESVMAVHMTQLEDEEIEKFAATGASVVHCPASNMKLASGFCPIKKLLDAGVNVALGTDGAASNNSLNMFSEMRLASLLAKGYSGDAECAPANISLRMATINGAKALGFGDKIGSLEVGKFADMVIVDTGSINMIPMYDVLSHLVYCCERSNVTDVWIQGKQVLNNRNLCTIDIEKVRSECTSHFEKLQAALKNKDN